MPRTASAVGCPYVAATPRAWSVVIRSAMILTTMIESFASGFGPAPSPSPISHICESAFQTDADWKAIRWEAVTELGQASNAVQVDAHGVVTVGSAASWPEQKVIDWAHGNNTRVTATCHPASKPDAWAFLSSASPAQLTATAKEVVAKVVSAGYDGLQLDWEGLKPQHKTGFIMFVAACSVAMKPAKTCSGQRPSLAVTVYAPKLVHPSAIPDAYNITVLEKLCDTVFIMGYDMTWVDCPMGDGWKQSGPNAPLNGLEIAIQHAEAEGVDLSKLVLGLPWYGRVFTCDGTAPAGYGSTCACKEKNVAKKTLDILTAVEPNCTSYYDEVTATPWWDCAYGANVSGSASQPGVRQQGWYENAKSLQAKVDLATKYRLAGVGVWTAHGVNAGATEEGAKIWNVFAEYIKGTR